MAETTVFPANQTAEPPPPAIRKGPGRPPSKDTDPARSVPRAGPEFITADEFFDQLSGITTDEWQYRLVYIYRTAPITDRRNTGQMFYLTKYGQAIDQDQIMRDFGSGAYRLLLNETRPGGGRNSTIARCDLSVMNYDYPPKVAPGEWVDDVRNRDWEWCRGKLGPQFQGNPPPSDPVDQMLKLQALTAKPEQKDRTLEYVAALTPLITALIPKPAPVVEPKEDKSLSMLFTMLQEQLKDAREEIREERKARAAEAAARAAVPVVQQKSPIEWALENEDMMRRIFGKGNGGPAAPEGWAGIADKAIDKLGEPLGRIGVMIAGKMMQPPPAAQQPIAPRPALAAAPVASPTNAQPIEQQPPAPVDQQAALFAKYQGIIGQTFPFLIDQFKDKDGYDFREWFIYRYGNMQWGQMRQEIGVDGFIALLATVPVEIQSQLSPPEKFKQFMTEFFSDDDPEGDDDEEFSKPPEA